MKDLNEYATPRTDEEIARVRANCDELIYPVEGDFARTLERENAALRELLENFVEHVESCEEEQLLACDADPHPPSVFSVYATDARAVLNATKP